MNIWSLPKTTEIGGRAYELCTDFRFILSVIQFLNDVDMNVEDRMISALAVFYPELEEMPISDYKEAAEYLMTFINAGQVQDDDRPSVKKIDWEQDAPLIISEVNKVAGQEVRALDYCHWWTFLAWFQGIGEGTLSTVVSLREKRRRGKKLSDWEREFYAENRSMVDLKTPLTAEEQAEIERLNRILDGISE